MLLGLALSLILAIRGACGWQLRLVEREPIEINANMTIENVTSMLLSNYDSNHRPGYAVRPTVVEINIYVRSFGSISVIDMDYTIDIMLRQRWRDTRLQFRGYNHTLSLSYLKDKIWIPDLFFRNAKHGILHQITAPNYLIWLDSDGNVTFSQKLTLRLACPMHLWNFPMDTQICPLEIGSYGFALTDLEFVWMRDRRPVVLSKQLMLNEFEAPEVMSSSCKRAYNTTGQFTCLKVEFRLERKFGFYLIYTYLPSVLIVIISWISFWIDYKAVPARITLGLLSVLALMTQASATVQKLPRVSYVKALDMWIFACLIFVVASLLEFALVNIIARRLEQRLQRDNLRSAMGREMRMLGGNLLGRGGGRGSARRQSQPSNHDGVVDAVDGADACGDSQVGVRKSSSFKMTTTTTNRRPLRPTSDQTATGTEATKAPPFNPDFKPESLDHLFAIVYPACFLLFNIIYWFTFMLHMRK